MVGSFSDVPRKDDRISVILVQRAKVRAERKVHETIHVFLHEPGDQRRFCARERLKVERHFLGKAFEEKGRV